MGVNRGLGVLLPAHIGLLRRLLGEDTHQPHFIETVSTVGYRFVCPVQTEQPPDTSSNKSPHVAVVAPIATVTQGVNGKSSSGESLGVCTAYRDIPLPLRPVASITPPVSPGAALAVGCGGSDACCGGNRGGMVGMVVQPLLPYVTGIQAITTVAFTRYSPLRMEAESISVRMRKVTLYWRRCQRLAERSRRSIRRLQVPWLRDIAPDKSSLLVSDLRSDNQPSPLWIVPVPAGAPRRVGNVFANAAAWTPDGNKIIFTKGREIWIAAADGSQMRKLWTAPNPSPPTWMLRVSPDGKRMRFDGCEQSGCALWEANTDGSDAHRLLPDWQEHSSQIPGAWSPDGRYYVFAVLPGVKERWVQGRWLVEEHWLLPERRGWFTHRRPAPVLLLARGPVVFDSPGTFSPDGRTLFVRGAENLAELVRYEAATHQTAPYLSGISATELAFSPDGQWVTYISVPDSSLWRSRMDGSGRVQLTSPGASIARWSPDGTRIAFEWAPPGETGETGIDFAGRRDSGTGDTGQ